MSFYITVAAMMGVTYIPRLLPFFALDQEKIPVAVKRWLHWLPYAALGALIIPGGIQAIEEAPLISTLGLMVAALLSWFFNNILASVLLTLALLYLIPIAI